MALDTRNEFDDTSLTVEDRRLADEVSDITALAESIEEEHLLYEQVIRELTEFEEAFDISPALSLSLSNHTGE